MRFYPLLLALAFISSGQAVAQDDVADWFPLHTGDKWTYVHETRDNNGGSAPAIQRWTTEETIVDSQPVPEGTLITRQTHTVGTEPAARPDRRVSAYLVRGNCLYELIPAYGEISNNQLMPAYRKALLAGQISADFCFPLVKDKTWGAPHWGDWRLPADAVDWQVKGPPENQQIFHIASISSYPGSGQTVEIWFQKGVGIVRDESIHHGTLGEIRTWLLHFEPASQRQ